MIDRIQLRLRVTMCLTNQQQDQPARPTNEQIRDQENTIRSGRFVDP